MEKKKYQSITNPLLPTYEYLSSSKAIIENDRLYLFSTHDCFPGRTANKLDPVLYSFDLDDLTKPTYEGTILKKKKVPGIRKAGLHISALSITKGLDNCFYLYYSLSSKHFFDNEVLVSKSANITGPFEFYGKVHYSDNVILGRTSREEKKINPVIFIDDDKKIYLYVGYKKGSNSPRLYSIHKDSSSSDIVYELDNDMLTIRKGHPLNIFSETKPNNNPFKKHECQMITSVRKFNNFYYLIYTSKKGYEICLAKSSYPDKDFVFANTLLSLGDSNSNPTYLKQLNNYLGFIQGDLLKISNTYVLFYQRMTNHTHYARQLVAEEVKKDNQGFKKALMTSQSLNLSPLNGKGNYKSSLVSDLQGKKGNYFKLGKLLLLKRGPYLTQSGKDRNEEADQYIKYFSNNSILGFRYFSFIDTKTIAITIKGKAKGNVIVYTSNNQELASIPITPSKTYKTYTSSLKELIGIYPLYFLFSGKGKLDFKEFQLK